MCKCMFILPCVKIFVNYLLFLTYGAFQDASVVITHAIAWKSENNSVTLPLNSATNERRAELAPAMPNAVRNAKISNRSHKFNLIVDLVVSRREGYPPTFFQPYPNH